MDAFHPTLANYLGLKAKDVAEIGGYTERYARDFLKGRCPWPDDLSEAVEELNNDVFIVSRHLAHQASAGRISTFLVFRNNHELRAHKKSNILWPVRGKSSGGFAGPHTVAVVEAMRSVEDEFNIEYYDS